jgi:pimeloyl-ACP methyl ester carboxylesterase
VLLSPAAELVEPDDRLRALWLEEERLVEAGDLDAATRLNVRAWLGREADAPTRELVRVMQRDALAAQVAAGDVDVRELPVHVDRLTMPTTVLVGAHDFAFFVETARELARVLTRATLVELEWAAHLPSLERPAETTRLVLGALTGS